MIRNKKIVIMSIAMAMLLMVAGCGFKAPEREIDVTVAPELDPEATRSVVTPTPTPDPLALLEDMFVDIDKDVVNILLLGTDSDSQDGDGTGRNDTTMILQIDRVNKTMKLVSFMRDIVVDIPGIGMDRLNKAYYYSDASYGVQGAARVAQVMDNYFDVEIDYYAQVSFIAFEQIMFVVGNVAIDVQETDVENLKYATRAVKIDDEEIEGQGMVQNPGKQEVTAYVAMSYVRDRSNPVVDESTGTTLLNDEARNYRQRELIKSAWAEVKEHENGAISGAVLASAVYANTDMPSGMIITLISEMMDAGAEIETLGIPLHGTIYSVFEDEETGELVSINDAKALHAEEKAAYEGEDEFLSYEDWRDAKFGAEKLGWSQSKNISAVKDFLNN